MLMPCRVGAKLRLIWKPDTHEKMQNTIKTSNMISSYLISSEISADDNKITSDLKFGKQKLI